MLAVVQALVDGCPPQGLGADLCFGGSSCLLCLAPEPGGLRSWRLVEDVCPVTEAKPSILGEAWRSGGFLGHCLIHESRSTPGLWPQWVMPGPEHLYCYGHSLLAAVGSHPCPVCLRTPNPASMGSCPQSALR